MKKEFSFNYGKKRCVFSAENNAVYELEKDITVEVVCKNYPDFNASYWMLYFENKSNSNSQMVSDIFDCDSLLPLTFPRDSKPGYKLVKGDACVITMNGMVAGRYYGDNDAVSALYHAYSCAGLLL